MGEVKHTPGPWKVGYRALDIMAPNPKGGEAKIFDVRGWGYLTGRGHGALALSDDEAEAVQQANARLVAAAPDMLAALKGARERLRYAVDYWSDIGAHSREDADQSALSACEAALAKAESSHGA